MKIIYLNETIQLIGSINTETANKIVESGEVRFLKRGEEAYPYVVIQNETVEDNVNDTKHR